MRKGDSEFYLKQEIENFFSTRTELFNLEPIGLGTPYVESLSSYLGRLALAHNLKVSILLKKVIAPHLNINHLKKELNSGITKGSALYINEIGFVSLEYVNALEIVTGRNDLLSLTMLNWKGIFSKKIRSKYRKWCPKCFEEWKLASKVIYEPLIWFLNDIQKCDIHEIQLNSKCPKCERELPFLHSRYRTGFCQYCESWLGREEKGSKQRISEKEAYIILGYKQLIENTPQLTYFPSELLIGDLLKRVIKQTGFNNLSNLANYLGFSSSTVSEWIRHKYVPSSKSLFFIGNKLNCNFYELLYNPKIRFNIDTEQYNLKKKRIPKNEVEKVLNIALSVSVPKSLYKIAEENNFYIGAAQRDFPEHCRDINNRYSNYLQYTKSQKGLAIINLLQEQLSKEPPISLEQISKINNYSKKTLKKFAPDLCEKLVKRYNEYLAESKSLRIAGIESEIKAAATKLHNQGFYPSIGKLQRELGNKSVFLEREVREVWREIVIALGYSVD